MSASSSLADKTRTDVDGQAKDCPLDPYVILHDRCRFVDQQTIKLQEAPDMVPVGELPRHMIMQAERWASDYESGRPQSLIPYLCSYLTGRVVPGSRIIATGIYSTFAPSKGVCPISLVCRRPKLIFVCTEKQFWRSSFTATLPQSSRYRA